MTSEILPFTHGLEIENFVVDSESGHILTGERLLKTWNQMFNRAAEFFEHLLKSSGTPKTITKKIKKIYVEEVIKREKRLKFIFVEYQLRRKTVKVNVFGPDPNISQITWLLELVTPPCESLTELEWWLRKLYEAASYGLNDEEAKLMTLGINPMEKKFRSGLTCGVHHHIGIPDRSLRMSVYNCLRNFVPHIIGLSGASPFIDGKPSGRIRIKDVDGKKQVISRDCIHSYRLLWNTGQMGPNIPDYLPALPVKGARKVDFALSVKKPPPTDRMVDIYPFTDYDTIELRFFDAVPWLEVHIAMVILIQAIAMKAEKLLKSKKNISPVNSKIIFDNRNKAIIYGLLANFTRDSSLPMDFAQYYNYDVTTGKQASKLIHSIKSMLMYLKEELEQLGNPSRLNPLVTPVMGTKNLKPQDVIPPAGIVEFLLLRYGNEGYSTIENILPLLSYSHHKPFPLTSVVSITEIRMDEAAIKGTAISLDERRAPSDLRKLSKNLKSDLQKRKAVKTTKKPVKPIVKKKAIKKPAKKEKVPPKVKPTTKQVAKKKKITKIKTVEKPSTIKDTDKLDLVDQESFDELPARIELTPVNKVDIITSASSQEIEVMTPNIPVDPRYKIIDSKIAKAMRVKRIQTEKKRRRELRKRLEKEKVPFSPPIKKYKFLFPEKVTSRGLFGYIVIDWPSGVHYKLIRNPVTAYTVLSVAGIKKRKRQRLTFAIDTVMAKQGVSRIPLYLNLYDFKGYINIQLEMRTATNEVILSHEFIVNRVIKKEGLIVEEEDFYITGRYGQVEMVFKALGRVIKKKDVKGKMRLFLASQSFPRFEEELYSTKFKVKEREAVEIAQTIDLDPILHSSLFWIVNEVVDKPGASFHAIKVEPIDETLIDWDLDTLEGPELKKGLVPKTKYTLDFLFHFNRFIPQPVQLEVYVTTFPEGRTKKIASTRIEKDINSGDDYAIEKVSIKTPKKIGYMYFSVDVTLNRGPLPPEFISEPVGIHKRTEE
ncbi:MAG: glutamate-cysteine ligase family protein [Candidatus Hodarchaeales archaeon]|jgi:hypothetical protein